MTPVIPRRTLDYFERIDGQSHWYLIGRVFGVGQHIADKLESAGKTKKSDTLRRVLDKRALRPINKRVMQSIRDEIDRALHGTALDAELTNCIETLALIDTRLIVGKIRYPFGTASSDFILGQAHQYLVLLRAARNDA